MEVVNATTHHLTATLGDSWLLSSLADAAYLYICTSEKPNSLLKVAKSSLSLVSKLPIAGTSPKSEKSIQASAIDDQHVYLCLGSSPGEVIKVDKGTVASPHLKQVARLQLGAGENSIQTAQLNGQFLFVAATGESSATTGPGPARIVKILKSTLTQVGSLVLNTGEVHPATSLLAGAFLYLGIRVSGGAGGGSLLPNSRIVKVNVAPTADCVLSGWAPWSICTRSCGSGVQSRRRSVVSAPSAGGRPCVTTAESRACNTPACAVPCRAAGWGPWSACSTPSSGVASGVGRGRGSGSAQQGSKATASRSVIQRASAGGADCPALTKTKPCTVDCKVSGWSAPQSCDEVQIGWGQLVAIFSDTLPIFI
jgi:hypothetical protein